LRKNGGDQTGEKYARMKQAVEWLPQLTDWIENAKKSFRGPNFYSIESYMESMKVMERWIELITSSYHPSTVTTVDNEMRYSVYSSKDIFSALEDREQNLFLDIFMTTLFLQFCPTIPDWWEYL
jgi:hypothetical protein